jgi:hypothetical protein
MLRALALLLSVCALASVVSAQSYTVTSGSGAYSDIASPTNVNLTANTLSNVISPSGFSANFFGSSFSSFKIGSNGYILMGSNGTVIDKQPNLTTAPGLVIAPAWIYLDPSKPLYGQFSSTLPGPGTIGWSFGSGVLEVEWKNIPIYGNNNEGVRMKLSLDTSSGEITFSYGQPHYNAVGTTSSFADTTCIAGPTATSPQEIIDGEITNYIKPDGSVTSWPTGQNVTFTPAGGNGPSISVSDGAPISPGQSAPGTNRDFGSRDITAGASAALTITITNNGTSNLDLNNFVMLGDTGDFVFDTNGTAGSVTPGNSTTISIAFDPATIGQKVATVNFSHNDLSVASPFTFDVTGLGTQTATAPILIVRQGGASGPLIAHNGSLDFGSMDIGSTPSTPMTVYIENGGNSDLTVGLPAISGGDFTVSAASFPATIAAGNSATFSVTFTPAGVGTGNEILTFTHNDASVTSPFVINLSGTATSSAGGGGGTSGFGGGGGGGGCVAATGTSLLWILLLALGASLGARTWGHRARG